ncbi:MAG: UDP-N-acetylmuramoyl-tripeptide--D-alanyl-D-alanine ligase [Bacteroidia bacterium]|nr:UDP-N-acetylmuramoyl-tripeptide--D-alanyl-D-alanine ligase [Bacteroidia bacterium]
MYSSLTDLYKHFTKQSVVCTDTRKISDGCIFFALKGPNFNGNQFAAEAIEKGATLCVVDENEYANEKCLLVENVLETLQSMANLHRKTLNIPIIAITGSNGKTTTKELCREILARKYNVFATSGNLNNHIGVPLSLLSLSTKHQLAIIEMGANHKNEIESLCKIAEPTYGLITNIGSAHLEGFGSIAGILKAKSELFDYLIANDGTIFFNGNDSHLNSLELNYSKIIPYGSEKNSFCELLEFERTEHLKIKWKSKNEPTENIAHSSLTGDYNIENILAATCVGSYFGVPATDINLAIRNYESKNNRSQIVIKNSNTIVLDAYNANPSSMMAAISNFSQSFKGVKIPVLGEMHELGNFTKEEHKNIFNELTKLGFEEFILVGNNFEPFKTKEQVKYFNTASEAGKWIQDQNFKNANFLIKGSRATGMEKVMLAFE